MENGKQPIYPSIVGFNEKGEISTDFMKNTSWFQAIGITKDEYFASLFLQGIISTQSGEISTQGGLRETSITSAVRKAIELKNEFLKQLSEETNE